MSDVEEVQALLKKWRERPIKKSSNGKKPTPDQVARLILDYGLKDDAAEHLLACDDEDEARDLAVRIATTT